ncbi:MAG: hypothetical protein KKA79_06775, partial [Nanoarchaeota archaeon]|nr:hypothetical protein [Nanoarchaeota archaeon]
RATASLCHIRAIRSRFYDKKDFDMIMKYCSEEFNFELMMGEFYLKILRNSEADKRLILKGK